MADEKGTIVVKKSKKVMLVLMVVLGKLLTPISLRP